ncbi:MAG: VCBS repeat-containing protein, partial [Chloroflexi bacterium]
MSLVSMRRRRLIVVLFAMMLALVSFGTILSAISIEASTPNQQSPTQVTQPIPINPQVQLEQLGTANLRLNTLPRTIVKVSGAKNMDWGDVDGDGDLDLAVPINGKPSRVFLNDNGIFTRIAWTEPVTRASYAAAWGDVDGDGDLDLAIGNLGDVNNLYLNISGTLQATPVWTDTLKENTRDLKWGDMNGDGRLDLVVGNHGQPNHIFANEDGMLTATPAWSDENPTDNTLSIDLADINNDQFLDFAVGNDNNPNNPSVIYKNAADGTFTFSQQVMDFTSAVGDIAWGDVNGDGYPELAIVDRWFGGIDGYFPNTNGTINANFPDWQPAQLSLGWSVAWGDADNDGDLDLAIGSSTDQKERVYLNTDGRLNQFHAWESKGLERGENMVWVDFDQDDDQDLILHYGSIIKVFINRQWPMPQKITWQDEYPTDDTSSIALGDMNNDGLLDMAVGNFGGDATRTAFFDDFGVVQGQPNRIYVNSSDGGIASEVIELTQFFSNTTSVAWGDVNGDGYLDLAVGNLGNSAAGEQNLLYVNNNGRIDPENAVPFGLADSTRSVTWGDVDQDGDLDLAIGNDSTHPNKLYLNVEGDLTATSPITFGLRQDGSTDWTFTTGMAWGDVDNDGDLDLAVSNYLEPNRLYINVNGRISDNNVQTFGSDDQSLSVAWGDVNGDGRLDLAVGNSSDNNHLYLNYGGWLASSPSWSSLDADDTQALAWGDVDGDGDLDLAAANRRGQGGARADKNIIYVNQRGVLQTAVNLPWTTNLNTPSSSVAWGDLDNDGDLDLVFGNERITDIYNRFIDNRSGSNRIYWNKRVATTPLSPNQQPATIHLQQLADDTQTGVNGEVLENGRIAIEYTLTHPQNRPYRSVRGLFSLDGGGSWALAQPVSTTLTTNITTTPGSNTHIYNWDVIGSNIFGRSNHVIFRLEAYETANSMQASPPDTYSYTHQRVEAGQRPFIAANTTPFRVEGTQIRVLLENDDNNSVVTNALI